MSWDGVFPSRIETTYDLASTAVLVNVVASLIFVPVAILVFKDDISWVNILEILVCLAGLMMFNWQR